MNQFRRVLIAKRTPEFCANILMLEIDDNKFCS